LIAARAQGNPTIVIAMRRPAITQPTAIHRPPKRIHSTFSKREKADTATRLDSSTNWAVVTTGIALSATYSSAEASPLPLVLVGLLVGVSFCSRPAATDISTSGGHARVCSRSTSTRP
jgi:uncharacterized membrane protein